MPNEISVLISELRKDLKRYASKSESDYKDLSKKLDDSSEIIRKEFKDSFKELDSRIDDIFRSCNDKITHEQCNISIRERNVLYEGVNLKLDKNLIEFKTRLSNLDQRISRLENGGKEDSDRFLAEVSKDYRGRSKEDNETCSAKDDYDVMFL